MLVAGQGAYNVAKRLKTLRPHALRSHPQGLGG